MIITIFSEDDSTKRSILAANLAVFCALQHRKVMLIDATSLKYSLHWGERRTAADARNKLAVRGMDGLPSELENPASYYRSHFQDIIVDTDGSDSWSADSALVATDVLLVPIASRGGDVKRRENLIQRIEALRLFNPALRVLVIELQAISAFGDASATINDARAFAENVLTATLAETVIHEWLEDNRLLQQGQSAFDSEPRNQRAIAEIENLYQEIARVRDLRLEAGAYSTAILNAIQRRTVSYEPVDAHDFNGGVAGGSRS
jgi:chromosome partitioning protein